VKKQIDLLVQLQGKDQAIERLRWRLHEGPERLQGLERQLHRFEEEVEDVKVRIHELKKAQRQYEADIEDAIAHIKKSRGRLMSIKNNKEYQALLKEIEETEKGNADKEDKVLTCLEELEGLNQEVEAKEKDVSAMRDHLKSEEITTAKEVAHVQEELSDMDRSRVQLMQTIDSQLLAKYEQIKTRGGGIAVALVNDATCSECHLSIPPQMYNELQRQNTLKFCPNCQRIIYWKEAEPAT
jgi:predicted  nucleic acid-binding Zn-ribbon protein